LQDDSTTQPVQPKLGQFQRRAVFIESCPTVGP